MKKQEPFEYGSVEGCDSLLSDGSVQTFQKMLLPPLLVEVHLSGWSQQDYLKRRQVYPRTRSVAAHNTAVFVTAVLTASVA